MVTNTVDGVKIGNAAGKDKKFEICSTALQKVRNEKGIEVTNNNAIGTPMLFMPNGVIRETGSYIAIKAQNGTNPNKVSKKDVGLLH